MHKKRAQKKLPNCADHYGGGAGLTQTIMLSLSMVVIAALVGANGLGVPVVRALNSVNTALGFESGFIIVVVAILLDRMLRVSK